VKTKPRWSRFAGVPRCRCWRRVHPPIFVTRHHPHLLLETLTGCCCFHERRSYFHLQASSGWVKSVVYHGAR
jgi:hypothetical protein